MALQLHPDVYVPGHDRDALEPAREQWTAKCDTCRQPYTHIEGVHDGACDACENAYYDEVANEGTAPGALEAYVLAAVDGADALVAAILADPELDAVEIPFTDARSLLDTIAYDEWAAAQDEYAPTADDRETARIAAQG